MENSRSFNIQFVSNITGINPHTIRAWEKRYEAINPERDHNGRRLYNQKDIDRLNLLHDLVKVGNSISDIASLPSEELKSIHEQFVTPNDNQVEVNPNFDIQFSLQNIYMGLDFYKLDIIGHELSKAADSLNALDFALKFVEPIINKIRRLKQDGKLNINERASLFHLIKSDLMRKLFAQGNITNSGKSIIIGSARGQLNEIGALLTAILCKCNGYDIKYLGGNVPAQSLGEIANQFNINTIFIGLNYSYEAIIDQDEQNEYLQTVGDMLVGKSHILVGAYDQCFRLPYSNMECYDNFSDLNDRLIKI
jgi:DNA-binding transcriptional MerR regulator